MSETDFKRARMRLQSVLGQGKQGFFSPYRYAGSVSPLSRYPEIEAVFEARRDTFTGLLDAADGYAEAMAAFEGAPPAPRWDQAWFPTLDAVAAYTVVRKNAPMRIVEVGSGHSTRFLARAVADGGKACAITCIDPQPRATMEGLAVTWDRSLLSEAHLPLFDALEPRDIAFFDSSHLLWPGSDVDMIFNRILPRLKPGVIVHIHDVFWPDAYPDHWEWRGYTEQNGLGGWLLSGAYRPVFASRYAATRMAAMERPLLRRLPRHDAAIDTGLWLVRNG